MKKIDRETEIILPEASHRSVTDDASMGRAAYRVNERAIRKDYLKKS